MLALLFLSTFHFSFSSIIKPSHWVLTRDTRVAWSDVVGDDVRLVGTFGPDDRYALVHASYPALSTLEGVTAIQPNFEYFALGDADPGFPLSWGLQNEGQAMGGVTGSPGKDIGAVGAWTLYSGNPVVVAILDSGIQLAHEDLASRLWEEKGAHGFDFVSSKPDPSDDNGHGTFCAGIVGAEAKNGKGSRGIFPNAKLMAVKMLDGSGTGSTAAAISAIKFAVDHGAEIINASWGGGNYDQALFDTVKWAGDKGVLFVAAAGNDGKHNDTDASPTYPASFKLPNVISVAAYDNRDALASFSNYGKETTHVGAPGVAIYSTTLNGYKFADGTSYAAPFVAGTAALLKSQVPSLSVSELKDRLLMTSEPISYYDKERTQSAGRISAVNALRDFRPARPRPPTIWSEGEYVDGTGHPYENKTTKIFRVVHPRATHVRVHFKSFDTEGCCDRVKIRDGNGTLITQYAGALGDFWSADALGDTIVVEFTSDYSVTKHGFDIDRYEASTEP